MYKRQDEDSVLFVLRQHFPDGKKSALKAFAGLFLDLQIKAYHGEISTKSLDLRGLVSAVKATRSGLSPIDAIQMGIINKSFDVFEKEIIEDVAVSYTHLYYVCRWPIEVFFRQCKDKLALDSYQIRSVIIPGLSEPPVRTLRATIPGNESQLKFLILDD